MSINEVCVSVARVVDPRSESVASRVAGALNKLAMAMKSHAWAGAGERRLTPTQGQILALLRARGVPALRLTQVAEQLAISAPTASDSVRALVDKGLVRKTRAADDARAVALELTETGLTEAERAAAWPDFMLVAIGALTPAEQEAFLAGLIKVIGALVERGEIPMQRTCVLCHHFNVNSQGGDEPSHHCTIRDEPIATGRIRMDCAQHQPASSEARRTNLAQFVRGTTTLMV